MRGLLALTVCAVAACSPAPVLAPVAQSEPPAKAAEHVQSDAHPLLGRVAQIATDAGAGPMKTLAVDGGAEGDRVGAFASFEGGCLLLIARGSEGIDDLDMVAFTDDGVPVAADEAPDPNPALLLCPPTPRVFVMARIASGRGVVALGGAPVDGAHIDVVGSMFNAKGRPAASRKSQDPWPGLDARASASRRELGGRWEEVRRAAMPVDTKAPARLTTPLDAGRCLAALVTPSDDTADIDAVVLDEAGRIVGHASDLARDRVAVVCTSVQTQITIEARSRLSSGVVAVVLARSQQGSEGDIIAKPSVIDAFPSRSLPDARAAIARAATAIGYAAPYAQASIDVQAGRRARASLRTKRGCSRVDVVGGAPAAGLALETWSESGVLLGRAEGGAQATTYLCGDGGPVSVEVEATARPGPAAVELRHDEGVDAALGQAPLAASRLLTRMLGDAPGRPSSLAKVARLALDAQARKSLQHTVDAQRCVDVGVALVKGGLGVDVRVVDASSREELGASQAASTAAVRVCAGAAPRRVSIEASTLALESEALVGVRDITR